MKKDNAQEIIEVMQILIDNSMKKTTNINGGIITAINDNGKYSVKIRGKVNILPAYPKSQSLSVGDTVMVVVPQGENSQGFILPNSLDNLYYIKKSGDTINGNLIFTDNNIDTSSTPTIDISGNGIYINDVNNNEICQINSVSLSTGEDGIEISAIKKIDGTVYKNSITLLIDKLGNKSVQLSDADAWKTALGLS